jgi:hypothetical protein
MEMGTHACPHAPSSLKTPVADGIKMALLVLFLFVILVQCAMSCDDALCNHPDWGSCGNACCLLSFSIKESPESVMQKLNSTISSGGPDGLYSGKLTAEGTQTFADLRAYHPPGNPYYIGQTWHTTKNGLYNDTINFTITPAGSESSTRLVAFSISQIAGAYGDDGQNYFNVVQLLNSIWTGSDAVATQEGSSCPKSA